jgi:hydroxymethylpyrimidine/phosphomethylpyrimidine kinase
MIAPPIVLSIAGSDCSGGAGIQADLKTISALGGYAATAITAVTVQNTLGVQSVTPMTPDVVREQVAAVMSDLQPQAVKVGMIANAECVSAIVEALRPYPQVPVVCDPVMVSTSGRRLMSDDAVRRLCRELFPRCTLITPNLPEAAALLSLPMIDNINDMERTGRALAARYGCAVLIKGGHLAGMNMCDLLALPDATIRRYTETKIETRNLHGTGCTLSSAIATYLASGTSLCDAVALGKAYVHRAILRGANWSIGHGNGPLCHFESEGEKER